MRTGGCFPLREHQSSPAPTWGRKEILVGDEGVAIRFWYREAMARPRDAPYRV